MTMVIDHLDGSIATIAVYVHLGPDIPQHLLLNIERHSELFPNQKIVLVSNQNWENLIPEGVETFLVPKKDENSLLFDEMSKHLDFSFRNGFWQFTFQRLFVLERLHRKYPQRSLLHIESDVILMPNFPWQKFENLRHLAWLPVNMESDIAALVFSPNIALTQILVEELKVFASQNPSTNDMLALRHFALSNPNLHKYLPSITKSTLRGIHAKHLPESLSEKYFGGVFDPLAFGMWNFGHDPKNFFGIRRRYFLDESHYIDPSRVKLSYMNDGLIDSDGIPMFNLHLHSKDLSLFRISWRSSLVGGLSSAATLRKKFNFNLSIFLTLLKQNGRKKTFWEILSNVKGIRLAEKHRLGRWIKKFVKKTFKL